MTHTVIQFIDADSFGGSEDVAMQLLAGLDRSRWKPILLHHGSAGMTKLIEFATSLGIPSRAVPRVTKWNAPITLPGIVRELRAANPTVLHAHLNWPLDCRDAILGATLARVPAVVATSHLYCPILRGRFGRLRQQAQTACVDRYIAVSNGVKESLGRKLHIPDSKIRVVRNGICIERFQKRPEAALRASLTLDCERPVVFTPARLSSQKGHIYLIKAAELVPEALFVFAGDGPERRSLEEATRTLGLSERIRFLGHRQDIPQLLACCDLFVLPSLFEGLPLSILEAMAASKPVIATAIGGTDEAIVDGVTGLLVPPADPLSLAAAIRRLLSDLDFASRLAASAKMRVLREFSSQSMVRGVTGVYEELIAIRQPVARGKEAPERIKAGVGL